jgi:predicted ATP-binding protein involved in virulence
MPKQTLKQALNKLKESLEQDEAENTEQVENLAGRIEHQLEFKDVSDWDEDLVTELEQQVIEFEDQHPMIAGALKSIVNALQAIGV